MNDHDTPLSEESPTLSPLSSEWLEEIQRRSARFDTGQAETIPWEQVKAESIKRLGQ